MSTRAPAVLIKREPTRVAKCSFVGFREGVCVNYKVLLGKFWVSSTPSPKKNKKNRQNVQWEKVCLWHRQEKTKNKVQSQHRPGLTHKKAHSRKFALEKYDIMTCFKSF